MLIPCSNFDVTINPLRVARRVETATRTALGIPLAGILFPRTPSHSVMARLQAQKNRIWPGLRFCPLVGVSTLRKKEHNQVWRSVSRHSAKLGSNQQVNLTAYCFAASWRFATMWLRTTSSKAPLIWRPSYLFR
jgi:hypothetical protein